MSVNPYALSSPPFFCVRSKLNIVTPSVMKNTCAYCAAVTSALRAPIPDHHRHHLTGFTQHLRRVRTYHNASLLAAMATYCDAPLLKISACGTRTPEPPHASTPATAKHTFTRRSHANTKTLPRPSPPCVLLYTSSCASAK